MIGNKLFENPNKTEFLLFNSKNINVPISFNINLNTISPSESAKNLSIIFRSDMSMGKHISSVVKTCFLQLREFRHFRSFIPKSAANTFANAFIDSCINFCNSLLYDLPKYSLHRLQKVQNSVDLLLHVPLIRHKLLPFSNLYIGYLLNSVLTLNCVA